MSSAIIELVIDELGAGGDGVGRDADGRVTFVPLAAPGDRLRVRVHQARRDFARAEALEIIEPSPSRVVPPCAHFSQQHCGGCQWQHVAAEAQQQAKEALVARALRRLVTAGLAIEPLLSPTPPYHWRRRARLHWYRPKSATRAKIGFFAPRSQRVTDVADCAQLTESLQAAYEVVRRELGGSLFGRGSLHLAQGADGVHVVIEGAARTGAAESLSRDPAIVGVRLGGRSFGRATALVDGGDASADVFAQASEQGNDELVRQVDIATRSWRQGARVLELYAGAGNLTRALDGAEVLGVDRGPAPGRGESEWRQGDAAEIVAELAVEGRTFNAVVLDPPRQGAKDVVGRLGDLGVAEIVYVSCDPATLARDADVLLAAGYEPISALPIDLMPQTSHVEVVATFRR